MRCAIYCRKSTDREDKQIQSLHDQLRILKEFADREGLEVVQVFQEAHSAMKPGLRAEFNRMMAMIDAGKIDCVLAYHVNRLARNPVDAGLISYALLSKKLHSIRTPDRTYLPYDSTLLLSVEYGMATEQSVTLSKTVAERMRMKAERGWLPGKAPVGYLNNHKTREIDPDPETFQLVKRAWELLLRGDMSVREIAEHLERLGFRPGQTTWRKMTLLYDVFSNPFYYGMFKYTGEVLPGKHTPMVSFEDFQQAQKAMKRVGKEERKRSVDTLHYPGLIECLDCGCQVVGSIVRKKRPDGTIASFHYYACSGHRGCRKVGIREELIEEQITRELQRIAIPDVYAQFLKQLVTRRFEEHEESLAVGEESMQKALDGQTQKLSRLTHMRLEGEIDASEYKSLRSEISAEQDRLRQNITDSANRVSHSLASISEATDTAAKAYSAVFESPEGSNSRQRALLFKGMLGFSRGKLSIMLGPLLEEIAIFKPRIIGSPCPKIGDLVPANSEWWALAKRLQTQVSEQRLSLLQFKERSPHGQSFD